MDVGDGAGFGEERGDLGIGVAGDAAADAREQDSNDLGELTGGGVDDKAADGDVGGDERMLPDGSDSVADRLLGVVETFQPGLEVHVGALKFGFRDPAAKHFLPEMGETHVACSAGCVGDHHDLGHSKFIDGHNEAPHGGVPWRRDHRTGVLDDLRVAVPQAQRVLEEDREPCVHAAEHGKFPVRELVRQVLLVALRGHVLAVECEDFVYVRHQYFRKSYFSLKAALTSSSWWVK